MVDECGSVQARSNCSRRVSVRTIGELEPSRSPTPRACEVSATRSSSPAGASSNRLARWRRSSSAVGPSVGNQNVSAYSDRGS